MVTIPLFSFLLLGIIARPSSKAQCMATDADQGLTVTFTATFPVQIPPISTVFGAIVTEILKVVNCDFVQVKNVNYNDIRQGGFSSRTTVPVLTRYSVACMDPTTVITRQDGVNYVTDGSIHPRTTQSVIKDATSKIEERTSQETTIMKTLYNIAQHLASGIDPTNENLTVREFRYLREINTALFALNLVNSGLPLEDLCESLKDPRIGMRLEDDYIDQKQATDIICFASVYGLYLGQSNDEVLASLAALEFAVQMHAYGSENLRQSCESLNYSSAQILGIDAKGIQDNVCSGTAGVSDPTDISHPVIAPTMTVQYNNTNITPFPTVSHGASLSKQNTGSPWGSGPYSTDDPSDLSTFYVTETAISTGGNFTTSPSAGATGSIIFGTDGSRLSSATLAAGTVSPWYNTSSTGSADTDSGDALSTSQAKPSQIGSTGVSFYIPSRLARDRLRRHGRGVF